MLFAKKKTKFQCSVFIKKTFSRSHDGRRPATLDVPARSLEPKNPWSPASVFSKPKPQRKWKPLKSIRNWWQSHMPPSAGLAHPAGNGTDPRYGPSPFHHSFPASSLSSHTALSRSLTGRRRRPSIVPHSTRGLSVQVLPRTRTALRRFRWGSPLILLPLLLSPRPLPVHVRVMGRRGR